MARHRSCLCTLAPAALLALALSSEAAAQTFGAAQVFPVTGGAEFVATGDLNGDGRPDVVAVSSLSPFIGILLGDGAGGFATEAVQFLGFDATRPLLRDVNLDGNLDLLAADVTSASLVVLAGTGTGSFVLPASGVPFPAVPGACDVADVDENGLPDVVVPLPLAATLAVLRGSAAGGFLPPVSIAVGLDPQVVQLADFDRDGHVDAFVTTVGAIASGLPAVEVLRGDGTGSFRVARTESVFGSPVSVAVSDLSRDGWLDFAAAGPGTTGVSVHLSDGAGGFLPAALAETGAHPVHVEIVDATGDGQGDLLVSTFTLPQIGTSGKLRFVPGNGSGGFAPASTLHVATSAPVPVATDLDADGDADLVAASQATSSVLRFSNLTPQMPSTLSFGPGTPGCSGRLGIAVSGPAVLGAVDFGFVSTNAPRHSLGLCMLGDVADPIGSDPFGIGLALAIDVAQATELVGLDMTSDASGVAFAPAPIPVTPSLAGHVYFAQSIWIESTGAICGSSPFHLLASRGLQFAVLP